MEAEANYSRGIWTRQIYKLKGGDVIVHLFPVVGKKHTKDNCWCQPEVLAEDSRIIVHHIEH